MYVNITLKNMSSTRHSLLLFNYGLIRIFVRIWSINAQTKVWKITEKRSHTPYAHENSNQPYIYIFSSVFVLKQYF